MTEDIKNKPSTKMSNIELESIFPAETNLNIFCSKSFGKSLKNFLQQTLWKNVKKVSRVNPLEKFSKFCSVNRACHF